MSTTEGLGPAVVPRGLGAARGSLPGGTDHHSIDVQMTVAKERRASAPSVGAVANAPQGPPSRLTRGRSDSMLRTSTSDPSAQSAVGGLLNGGARGHAGLDLRPVPEDAGSTPASGGWFSKLLSPSAADGALPNEYRPERPSQSLNA